MGILLLMPMILSLVFQQSVFHKYIVYIFYVSVDWCRLLCPLPLAMVRRKTQLPIQCITEGNELPVRPETGASFLSKVSVPEPIPVSRALDEKYFVLHCKKKCLSLTSKQCSPINVFQGSGYNPVCLLVHKGVSTVHGLLWIGPNMPWPPDQKFCWAPSSLKKKRWSHQLYLFRATNEVTAVCENKRLYYYHKYITMQWNSFISYPNFWGLGSEHRVSQET